MQKKRSVLKDKFNKLINFNLINPQIFVLFNKYLLCTYCVSGNYAWFKI